MNREDRIRDIAQKHGFDPEAAKFMAGAIQKAGGRSAQWQHPGLGGFGQWIPGMTTLTPREPALEKRLEKLCLDLLALLRETTGLRDARGPQDPVWWPKTLGLEPDTVGAQDRVRYAYFSVSQRLAVDRGDGQVTVYDTGDHRVDSVQQVRGTAGSRLIFQSQRGAVDLERLPVVEVLPD